MAFDVDVPGDAGAGARDIEVEVEGLQKKTVLARVWGMVRHSGV